MRIELITPHTHAGRQYPAGATLDLPGHKAEWLIAVGTAKAAEAAEAAPAAPAAATPTGAKTRAKE